MIEELVFATVGPPKNPFKIDFSKLEFLPQQELYFLTGKQYCFLSDTQKELWFLSWKKFSKQPRYSTEGSSCLSLSDLCSVPRYPKAHRPTLPPPSPSFGSGSRHMNQITSMYFARWRPVTPWHFFWREVICFKFMPTPLANGCTFVRTTNSLTYRIPRALITDPLPEYWPQRTVFATKTVSLPHHPVASQSHWEAPISILLLTFVHDWRLHHWNLHAEKRWVPILWHSWMSFIEPCNSLVVCVIVVVVYCLDLEYLWNCVGGCIIDVEDLWLFLKLIVSKVFSFIGRRMNDLSESYNNWPQEFLVSPTSSLPFVVDVVCKLQHESRPGIEKKGVRSCNWWFYWNNNSQEKRWDGVTSEIGSSTGTISRILPIMLTLWRENKSKKLWRTQRRTPISQMEILQTYILLTIGSTKYWLSSMFISVSELIALSKHLPNYIPSGVYVLPSNDSLFGRKVWCPPQLTCTSLAWGHIFIGKACTGKGFSNLQYLSHQSTCPCVCADSRKLSRRMSRCEVLFKCLSPSSRFQRRTGCGERISKVGHREELHLACDWICKEHLLSNQLEGSAEHGGCRSVMLAMVNATNSCFT